MVRKWSARMVCLTVSSSSISRPRKGGSSNTITNTNNVRRVAIKWTKSKRWRASTYCLPSDSNPRHGESFSFGPNDYVLDNEFEDESSTGSDKAFYFLILFISLRVSYIILPYLYVTNCYHISYRLYILRSVVEIVHEISCYHVSGFLFNESRNVVV